MTDKLKDYKFDTRDYITLDDGIKRNPATGNFMNITPSREAFPSLERDVTLEQLQWVEKVLSESNPLDAYYSNGEVLKFVQAALAKRGG